MHKGRNHKLHASILQRLKDKFEDWKARCLSRAGRITLAKTVSNIIPIFFMQLERMPAGLHKAINREIIRWGGFGSEEVCALIKLGYVV